MFWKLIVKLVRQQFRRFKRSRCDGRCRGSVLRNTFTASQNNLDKQKRPLCNISAQREHAVFPHNVKLTLESVRSS